MPSDLELRINRTNTSYFIAQRPSQIILVPQERTKTVGGYVVSDGEPRKEQTFRIIELGTRTTPPILVLADGKQREAEFWLLGEWDAMVEIDDHWKSEDGREWIVGDIVRSNMYETRALVAERGR